MGYFSNSRFSSGRYSEACCTVRVSLGFLRSFREAIMRSSFRSISYPTNRWLNLCVSVVLLALAVPALAQTQQKHYSKKYSSNASSAPAKPPRSMPHDAVPQFNSKLLPLNATGASSANHVTSTGLKPPAPKHQTAPKVGGLAKPQSSSAPINFSYHAPSSPKGSHSNSHRSR